jgi:hypothetical protein
MSWRRNATGSRFCPSLFSCSKMICVSTERVISSPDFASKTAKSSPLRTIVARSSRVT